MKSRYYLILVGLVLTFLLSATYKNQMDLPVPIGKYEFEYPSYFGNRINTTAGNPTTKQGVYLGRMLFYEKKLSLNNAVSCATCHQQNLAFTDGKTFSTGFGIIPTSRNSMSIANLLWVQSFFWDGRAKSLEEQGEFPINHPDEMGGTLAAAVQKLQQTKNYPALFKLVFGSDTIDGDRITKALAQFERTLISANSNYDKYLQGSYKPNGQELKGINLFFGNSLPGGNMSRISCGHCHGGPKTFTNTFHNNGLDSLSKDPGREKITGFTSDKGRFRVATLRNIALTAPYMHDGRFKTLDQVVDHYSDHIQQSANLSPFLQNEGDSSRIKSNFNSKERNEIIAFLNMLTDSTFITDQRFSNPFK